MRILLIAPDTAETKFVEMVCASAEFSTYTSHHSDESLDLAMRYDYDIIILDFDFPDKAAYDVLKKIRMNKVTTPVIVVSGWVTVDDKVRCLDLGADDYLTRPFHNVELLARMRAIVRRANGHAHPTIVVGLLTIDLTAQRLIVNGTAVHLTKKEFCILEALALRKSTPISRVTFMNHLYGGLHEPEMPIVDVLICRLRKKISAVTGDGSYIRTVWGYGYELREPAKDAAL
jgi:two-component system cell cycle response regulator CtrA